MQRSALEALQALLDGPAGGVGEEDVDEGAVEVARAPFAVVALDDGPLEHLLHRHERAQAVVRHLRPRIVDAALLVVTRHTRHARHTTPDTL